MHTMLRTLLLLTSISIIGCQGSLPQGATGTPRPGAPKNGLGASSSVTTDGGVDSSGGETPRSESALIRKAVKDALPRLTSAFDHTYQFYREVPDVQKSALELARHREGGPEADQTAFLLNVFTEQERTLFKRLFTPDSKKETVFEKIKLIDFYFQNVPCTGEFNDPRDMSVTPNGVVCVSLDRLKAIPPQHLEIQLLALLSMEASHLMGLGRTEATAVRDWFLANTNIVSPSSEDFTKLVQFLNDLLQKEGGVMAMASRKTFSAGQIYSSLSECESLSHLIKTLFLRHRIIRLPVFLEYQLYKLYYTHSELKYAIEPAGLGKPAYDSEKQGMRSDQDQQDFLLRVRKLQDEALKILNKVLRYQDPLAEPIHLSWNLISHRMNALLGIHPYSDDHRSVSGDRISCRLFSKDGHLSQSFILERLEEGPVDRWNILNTHKFPLQGTSGQTLGELRIDGNNFELNVVRIYFVPKKHPSPLHVRSKNSPNVFGMTEQNDGKNYDGAVGFLDNSELLRFSTELRIEDRSHQERAQTVDFTCEVLP